MENLMITNHNYKNIFKYFEYADKSVANRNNIQLNDFENELALKENCYKSLYRYDENIISHGENLAEKSVAGYKGAVWTDEIVIDIDCKDELDNPAPKEAFEILKKLLLHLEVTFDINPSYLRYEFSGSKGFHIRIPSVLLAEFEPSDSLPKLQKKIVEKITDGFKGIDTSIYKTTGLMRIPNSKHGISKLYSIPLDYENLKIMSIEDIVEKASNPNYDYCFIDDSELEVNERLEMIKEEALIELNDTHDNTVGMVEVDKHEVEQCLPIHLWEGMVKNCRKLRRIIEGQLKHEVISNEERMFLGTLLVPFGELGKSKLHEILSSQKNYTYEKTEYHFQSISENSYKPFLCETMCEKKCRKIKLINRNSPIAFARDKHEKYNQSLALQEVVKYNDDRIIFITKQTAFYKYDNGLYQEMNIYNLESYLEEFLNLFFPAKEISEQRINSLKKRLRINHKIIYNGDLNPTSTYLNLQNGMYDLVKGEFLPHSPKYKSTVQLNVEYNPKARCDLFLKKVNEIFDSNQDVIDYWLQWMLYSLLPTYQYQKFLILYGTGRNGKGVLTNVLVDLIGRDNAGFESFTDLSTNRDYSLIHLKDKYVNFSSELSTRDAETETIKRLTGGDIISAREIYKGKVQFKNFAKLIVSTNSIPRVTNLDKAFMHRIEIIEFPKSFADKPDTKLGSKLRKELSGILNLIIAKREKVIQSDGSIKLIIPEIVNSNVQKYLFNFHSASEFLRDECTVTNEVEDLENAMLLKTLYDKYQQWAKYDCGYKPVGKKIFKEVIESTSSCIIRKIPYIKDRRGNAYKNQYWVFGVKHNDEGVHCICYYGRIRQMMKEDPLLTININEVDYITTNQPQAIYEDDLPL